MIFGIEEKIRINFKLKFFRNYLKKMNLKILLKNYNVIYKVQKLI